MKLINLFAASCLVLGIIAGLLWAGVHGFNKVAIDQQENFIARTDFGKAEIYGGLDR